MFSQIQMIHILGHVRIAKGQKNQAWLFLVLWRSEFFSVCSATRLPRHSCAFGRVVKKEKSNTLSTDCTSKDKLFSSGRVVEALVPSCSLQAFCCPTSVMLWWPFDVKRTTRYQILTAISVQKLHQFCCSLRQGPLLCTQKL